MLTAVTQSKGGQLAMYHPVTPVYLGAMVDEKVIKNCLCLTNWYHIVTFGPLTLLALLLTVR